MIMSHDEFAGVNYDGTFKFIGLPERLTAAAQRQFGYFGTLNPQGKIVTPARGGHSNFFTDAHPYITVALSQRTANAFTTSIQPVRDAINNAGANLPPANLSDQKLIARIQEKFPDFMPQSDTQGDEFSGLEDAAAFKTAGGTTLLIEKADFEQSPIQSGFMRLTRQYAEIRKYAAQHLGVALPHPKTITTVLIRPGNSLEMQFADLGAYGSTMEGRTTATLLIIEPKIPPREITSMAENMPPLYSDIIAINPAFE